MTGIYKCRLTADKTGLYTLLGICNFCKQLDKDYSRLPNLEVSWYHVRYQWSRF